MPKPIATLAILTYHSCPQYSTYVISLFHKWAMWHWSTDGEPAKITHLDLSWNDLGADGGLALLEGALLGH